MFRFSKLAYTAGWVLGETECRCDTEYKSWSRLFMTGGERGMRGLGWAICGMYLMLSHSWLTLVTQPPPPEQRLLLVNKNSFWSEQNWAALTDWAGLPTLTCVSWSHTKRISEGRESWREGRGYDAVCTARLDRLETPKTDPLPLLAHNTAQPVRTILTR